MADKKVYQIEINGIKESANAVEALNKQLSELENRIKTLEKSNVKINSSSSSSSSSSSFSKGSMDEEAKLARQIEQIDEKRNAYSKEIYQNYLAAKDVLKETVNDQKQIAAQERLQADNYTNTMAGMKQHMADLKSVLQSTDLSDESFQKIVQEINEINSKLKEVEQSYGQYGRNVGNYAEGVAEGMQKASQSASAIKIEVNGVTREFADARQASRELNNELKSMAINGQQGTEEFKEMQKAVAQLNSDIKDATVSSKAMDNILDTLQGFAALGSIGEGVSALFGIDNDEIERSIQKLVALQNVMQGIEEIRQQMNTGEGVGGWLAKGNQAIDSFVAKITGAKKAQVELNTATTTGVTASKGLATAQEAQAVATTKASVATKGLSLALKSIGIGLIISAVAYLVTNWKEVYKWFTDTIPALKNLSTWFDNIKAVVMGVGEAILNFLVQPLVTVAKVIQDVINGDFSKIGSDVVNGLKKQYNVIGNFQKGYYRETERQQEAHNEKMREQQKKANEEFLKDEEAKYGTSHKRTQEYLKKQMALTKKGSDEYKELQRRLWADERQEREENTRKSLSSAKKETNEYENEITQIRLSAMKEGLNKTITQLEEERKQRLAKLSSNTQAYKKYENEINNIYDQKILDAKKKWAEKVENVYKEMWDNIDEDSLNNERKITQVAKNSIEIFNQNLKDNSNEYFNQGIGSYGIQGKNQLSPTTQFSLGIGSENKSKLISETKEYIDLWRELRTVQNEYNAKYHQLNDEFNKLSDERRGQLNMDLDLTKNYIDELKRQLDKFNVYMNESYGEDNFNNAFEALMNESYSSDLSSLFEQRMSAIEAYWSKRKSEEANHLEELYKRQLREEDKAYKVESGQTWNHYQDRLKEADKFYEQKIELIKGKEKSGEITLKEAEEEKRELEAEYKKSSKEMFENYIVADEALRILHNQKVQKLEQDKNNKLKQTNSEYYQSALQELRDFQTAQSNLESKQPIKNAWGIINLGETYENNENLLKSYESMANKIRQKRAEVNQDYKNGLIDKDVFESTNRELDNFSANLGEKMDKVKKEMSLTDQIGALAKDIHQYFQITMQTVQDILSAVWNAQDTQFEKEQEALDKWNDELNEKLDEQRDIIQEHKDAIDSIEDELATARGDRRQHLIDQLNAEMQAQREAQKQEQKIQKEKQKAQDKQDKLEKKRKEAEYKRNIIQMILNGAMAVSMAAVNTWPVPAIPMMALAAASTAAQLAIALSNKPYAKGGQLDGGVAQGKRHRDGGIPVLGGRASIEGGEFITNRLTTQKNVDLLEYINSKKKRIDIGDLMEFYSSAPRKTIKGVRTKFEDGGYLPTLPNSLDIRDQLQNVIINQDNRPIYVSVVDINNKQEDVRRVQTLAGL